MFLLGGAALLLYRRAHRASSLGLALIGAGALALALAAAAFGFVALVLLVPLAGAALGLFATCCWAASARVPARSSASRCLTRARIKRACRGYADRAGSRAPASLTTLLPVLWVFAALMIALIARCWSRRAISAA